MEFQYEYAGKSYPVKMTRDGDVFKAIIADKEYSIRSREVEPGFFILNIDGKPTKVSIATEGNMRHIFHAGSVYRFTKLDGRRKKGDVGTISPDITSPISGKVVKVDVAEGDIVETGTTLIAIEAMKMEYQIKAPFDGTVSAVKFAEGDQVDIGVVLIIIDKKETDNKEGEE